MLHKDIISPSESPWSAPVKKKGGELRFCVDYRQLNAITKKDAYPIPRIDETLDLLQGKKLFSTLDLACGYWQIELDYSSNEKTAFVAGNQLFEFKRMPFGLCNGPSTFQRLMNKIFRNLIGKFVLVYFNDIIIYSSSLEEHIQHL